MTFAFLRHLSKIGHDYSDNISIVLFFKKEPVGTDRIITVQHCLLQQYTITNKRALELIAPDWFRAIE